MSNITLPRHPMLELDDSSMESLRITKPEFTAITSSGDDPCPENLIWPGPVTFGSESGWSPESDDLSFSVSMSFKPSDLFGKVACRGAELLASLEWYSQESSQRGFAENPTAFRIGQDQVNCEFHVAFDANQLRGNVNLAVQLYLLTPADKPSTDERHLANSEGMWLGSLSETCVLAFDGTGSLFPVSITSNKSTEAPLWKITYNSSYPEEDMFTPDNVCMEINRDHPDFKVFMGKLSDPSTKALARQVNASWWTQLFSILRDEHHSLYERLPLPANEWIEGSIAHAASYIISVTGGKHMLSSMAKVSESMQAYFTRTLA